MQGLFYLLLVLLGLSFGSFLNAWEWRLRMGIPLSKKRSMCRSCQHPLSPPDLIPVVSFLFLRGHCRYCQTPISKQYPLVEATMGLIFFLVGLAHWNNGMVAFPELIRDLFILFILTFLFIYDLKYQELPDAATVPSIFIIGLASYLYEWRSLSSLLIGMFVGAGMFLLQYLISKGKWIGGGDIRLGALMGVVLGWPVILVALFLAYVGGSLIAVSLLLLKKTTWKSQMPFGTFLAVATVVAMIWGEKIITWYMALIRL